MKAPKPDDMPTPDPAFRDIAKLNRHKPNINALIIARDQKRQEALELAAIAAQGQSE